MENSNQKQEDGIKGRSCNASVSTPFFIFIGVAAVAAIAYYLIFG